MHHGAAGRCITCGAPFTRTARCAACGAQQPDPLVGRTIGNRYEILELLGVGGMGRVYRALHVGLDRLVAVKFIDPKNLTNQAAVARFMVEARAASRLSHPHVIAIHDFGGGSPSDGDELYLVMELLSGPSLGDVLRAGPMPIPRVIDVLCQILGALDEAHHQGVTHRDIKPENIVLEPSRSQGDHVKVIDFGIAKVHAGTNVTGAGEIVGTPRYMSPEQARGRPVGPEADIYAVGVLMFQMLTGQRAFDAPRANELVAQILSAPRPNPRVVAPARQIPEALSAVCVRAMAIDPAQRFPGAEAFARAILAAAALPWSPELTALFSPRAGAPERPRTPAQRPTVAMKAAPPARRAEVTPTPAPTPPSPGELHRPTVRMARVTPPILDREPVSSGRSLLGRSAELAWARDHLSSATGGVCLALWGRAGIGKTRLLDEVARVASHLGARVIKAPPGPPPPLGEVSGDGLRAMIPVIVGDRAAELDEPEVSSPVSARRAQGAALRRALERAVAAARSGLVLITIDDVDRLDGVSQLALATALSGAPIPGLAVAMTSEQPPGRWAPERVKARRLEGLAREDARRWLGGAPALRLPEGDVEPLHVELLSRGWGDGAPREAAPGRLADLVERRLRGLTALELRVAQAVAVLGRAPAATLAKVLDHEGDLGAPLAALEQAYLVVEEGGALRLRHALFGRAALALAPRSVVVDLHARAARTPASGLAELQAHHALRGRPGADALLVVEDAARLRVGLGDEAGAIRLLGEAFQVARGEVLAGELDAATAWAPLGRRLGALLVDAARADEAYGVLRELLQHLDAAMVERALVSEQLAQVARRRGRNEEAVALLREALEIAEALDEDTVATRLRLAADPKSSGVRSSARGAALAKAMGESGKSGGGGMR